MVCFALKALPSVSMSAMGLQRCCGGLWSKSVFRKQGPIKLVPKWCEVNVLEGEVGELLLSGSEERYVL